MNLIRRKKPNTLINTRFYMEDPDITGTLLKDMKGKSALIDYITSRK